MNGRVALLEGHVKEKDTHVGDLERERARMDAPKEREDRMTTEMNAVATAELKGTFQRTSWRPLVASRAASGGRY